MIPHERSEGERVDLPPDKDFEESLFLRLYALTPRFMEIRAQMGAGSEIGFGIFPGWHGKYSLGALGELVREGNGDFRPSVGNDFARNIPVAQPHIVVAPEHKVNDLRVVSIYQRDCSGATLKARERLLRADDEIFEGIVAHELAHLYRDHGQELPLRINDLLDRRRREKKECMDSYPQRDPLVEFDFTDEAEIDLIASEMGFGSQITAKLLFNIESLKTYPLGDSDDTSFTSFLTASSVTRTMRARLREVERYCT